MPVYAFSLPAVFIGLAGVMLLLAMAALWQSLRTAFGGGPPEELGGAAALGERAALLAEKRSLLRAIKDIQFEREVGKISDDDFARLDKAYRRRAKEVLRLLDQDLGELLGKAETLVSGAMGEKDDGAPPRRARPTGKVKPQKPKGGKAKRKKARRKPAVVEATVECAACGTDNDPDATFCKSCAARIAPLECAACGTENDPDATFCKSCAKPLGDDSAAGVAASASAGGGAPEGAKAAVDRSAASVESADDESDDDESDDDESDDEGAAAGADAESNASRPEEEE